MVWDNQSKERPMASLQERDRRYQALRAAMASQGLEVLIIHGRGGYSDRGAVRYVADLYMWGGETYVILPRQAEPILFQPGYMGFAWAQAAGWIADNRSAVEPPTAVAETLLDLGLGRTRIGIVGLETTLPVRSLRTLEACLPGATLQDATALLNKIKIVKSAEEIGYLRETSEIMKRGFTAMEAILAPGVTERQLVAQAESVMRLHGMADGFALISRSTRDPVMRPPTEDIVQKEDVITCDWEFAGPHGYCLELSGQYSFRRPPDKLRRVFEAQMETYQRCLEVMKPGVSSARILETIAATYQRHGFELPGVSGFGPVQFHVHGIGLDFTEPPLVPGHDLALEEGMVVALHPHIGPEDRPSPPVEILDNVLVTSAGGERLTRPHTEWRVL
jgi:Xaa-Pro dipeptidase